MLLLCSDNTSPITAMAQVMVCQVKTPTSESTFDEVPMQSESPIDPLNKLLQSVQYDNQTGELQFTTPNQLGETQKRSLLISGRIRINDSGMSWHAFETESADYSWIPGKTYTTQIDADGMDYGAFPGALQYPETRLITGFWHERLVVLYCRVSSDFTQFFNVQLAEY